MEMCFQWHNEILPIVLRQIWSSCIWTMVLAISRTMYCKKIFNSTLWAMVLAVSPNVYYKKIKIVYSGTPLRPYISGYLDLQIHVKNIEQLKFPCWYPFFCHFQYFNTKKLWF